MGRIRKSSGGCIDESEMYSFKTIVPTAGSNVVADALDDILTLTSINGTVDITGNSSTDTINFDLTYVYAQYSFVTVNCPSGTDPVADDVNDTLNFTSSGGTITITGDNSTDTVNFDLSTNYATNSFSTISTPSGTNPVADSVADTLTFTSTGGTITITGNSSTDTINFENAGATIFSDSVFAIQDNVDITKQAKFEVSGISSGTIRTFTFPDANTTLIGTDSTQTISNKTIDNSNVLDLYDTNVLWHDSSDPTKRFRFDASNGPAATILTYTLPNAAGELLAAEGTVTVIEKTFTADNAFIISDIDLTGAGVGHKFVNFNDDTKSAVLKCDMISTGTQWEYSFPNKSGTFALLDDLADVMEVLSSDPASPVEGQFWLKKTSVGGVSTGNPIGLLLSLTYASGITTSSYEFSVYTDEGSTVRVAMA